MLSTNLLLNYKREILEILLRYDFNFFEFYALVLSRLTLCWRYYSNFFTNGLFIGEVKRVENKIIMSTDHGVFEAICAVETLGDSRLFQDLKQESLKNHCYFYAEYLLIDKKFDAITSLCKLCLGGYYIHS